MSIDLIAEKRLTQPEAGAAARLFAGKLDGADLFRLLVLGCMPARGRHDGSRSASWYLQFIAMVYRVAPETFKGLDSAEIARRVGAEVPALEAELAEAERLLRRPGDRRSRKAPASEHGSFPGTRPIEVPREALGSPCETGRRISLHAPVKAAPVFLR